MSIVQYLVDNCVDFFNYSLTKLVTQQFITSLSILNICSLLLFCAFTIINVIITA